MRHDGGMTAGVVGAPDVGRPNASGGNGMGPVEGVREAGAPSCLATALERLAIALDEDRAQDPDADLPFVCDRRDVEAVMAENARLRAAVTEMRDAGLNFALDDDAALARVIAIGDAALAARATPAPAAPGAFTIPETDHA